MAEGKHSGSKNFGKVFQKTVFRTKEKVLQNLGKADKTHDDEFDNHVQNFTKQQATANKLQKELKNYLTHVRAMSVASKTFYETIRDTYEEGWTGHSEITGAAEALSAIWEDYLVKLTNQVQEPLNSYVQRFPDTKHKISKRNRKLMDYDGTRHTLDSATNQKKKDDIKIQKATDDMNSAKKIYEEIAADLHYELPNLYENRKSVLASILNSMFSSDGKFLEESAKIKYSLADATERLNQESSDVFFKQYNSSPQPRSSSSSTPPTDRQLKAHLANDRVSTHSSEPSARSDRGSEAGSVSQDASASPASKTKSVENEYFNEPGRFSGTPNGDIDSTPTPEPTSPTQMDDMYENVMVDSQHTERTLVTEDSVDDLEDKPTTPILPTADPSNNNEAKSNDTQDNLYSVAMEAESDYSVPLSNEPVKKLPGDVLYQVQATHAYAGDDTDELTFEVGDMINVIEFDDPEDQDDGWLMGIKLLNGEKGVFPENFTKRV